MKTNSTIPPRITALLISAWVAQAVTQVITFGGGMMLPGIIETFGVDVGVMGQVSLVAGIFAIIMTIPMAVISTKFNPKIFMTIVLLAISASIIFYGLSPNIAGLYIGKTIISVFSQAIATTLVLVKVASVPQDRIQQVNGVESFVGPIGQVIATLFMAQLLSLLGGWRNVYLLLGVIMIICTIAWFITYGDGKNISYQKEEISSSKEKGPSPLKEALSNKNVWLVALAWPFTTIIWIAMFTYWPTYAISTHGLSLSRVGLVLSLIPIFSAIASLTSPIIASKIGYDKPLIWPWGFILPIMYFGMLKTGNIVLLCVFSAIAGYGAYCFVPLAFTIIYKLGLSQKAVSMGVSIVYTFIAIGSTLGGGLVGILGNKFGLYNTMAFCCLTPIVFGILTLMLPELGRKKMEELAKEKTSAEITTE